MINDSAKRGIEDALSRFKLANIPGPGILDRLKGFGAGQVSAATDLFRNVRGGLGGQMNPNLISAPVPPQSMDMARATHRQQAIGNLGQLAPSLAAGGLYALHRHGKAQDEEARRRAMMMQQGFGPPA